MPATTPEIEIFSLLLIFNYAKTKKYLIFEWLEPVNGWYFGLINGFKLIINNLITLISIN